MNRLNPPRTRSTLQPPSIQQKKRSKARPNPTKQSSFRKSINSNNLRKKKRITRSNKRIIIQLRVLRRFKL